MQDYVKSVVQEQLDLIPEHCRGAKKCNDYICYIVRSTRVPARTYSGSTNHFVHRLRQHNCLIKGGARATHTDGPWKICCLISGFSSKSNALRFEYFTKIKHSRTYRITMAQGKNSIQRRAALLLTAELKMKPDERRRLSYFVPDAYMAECLREARLEGVPGTMEAAWFPCKPPVSGKMCYVQENASVQKNKESCSEDDKEIENKSEESCPEDESKGGLLQEKGGIRDARVQKREIALGISEGSDSQES
jgi:predicted GIY-YIG superfamily endonuclease